MLIKIGHLKIQVTEYAHRLSVSRILFIDWRVREHGKRWRIQIQRAPLWFPMYSSNPTLRGKCWAYWAIGNEQGIPRK
jgi:hypothetical protein